MELLFSINVEGGPLLCMDADAGRSWRGIESGNMDYANLCKAFDESPDSTAIAITIEACSVIAWETSGAGTVSVFRSVDGSIRVVRAWVDDDTTEKLLLLASAEPSSFEDTGTINVPSGLLAFLWAPESGFEIPRIVKGDSQSVPRTAIDGSGFVLKVSSRAYHCQCDNVAVKETRARRLTLKPGRPSK